MNNALNCPLQGIFLERPVGCVACHCPEKMHLSLTGIPRLNGPA